MESTVVTSSCGEIYFNEVEKEMQTYNYHHTETLV